MSGTLDELMLRKAESLAWEAVGTSSPNPPVGCIVLDSQHLVAGEGHTQPAGGPHAEVVALAAAGRRARGGTAYVTLEPCGHRGRTGPCAEALAAAGIRRVVHAVDDPQPGHSGAGRLRELGIEVRAGVAFAAVAGGSLRAWLHQLATGRPWVTLKLASTLDGRAAAADGSSRWITGPAARADVRRLRRQSDAVLVGTGTVLADDPRLTVHDDAGTPLGAHQPLRVVLGRRQVSGAARVLDEDAPSLRLTDHHPHAVLRQLGDLGALRVLIEGGPRIATAYLRAGAVDELVLYLAPTLLGAGPACVGDLGVGSLAGAWPLRTRGVTQLGPDIRLTADI